MNGRQILISTHADSLFPAERTSIVSAWSSESVSSAFQKLISNRILSVPVYDVQRRRYTHFLDMVDVVAYAVESFTVQQEPSHLTQAMDTPLLQTVNCGDITDKSKRNPYYPVETGAPLLEVLNLMVKWGVHRIPVVDAEGELHTIISQSQLATFIYKYLRSFPSSLINQTASSIAASIPTIEESETDTPSKVISVGLKDRAIDAFITMHDKRISGVAVVDENDTIVGNISASDLKAIGYDGTLVTRLFYPVSEFLRLLHAPKDAQGNAAPPSPSHPTPIPPPTTVLPGASFGTVLGALVNGKIHRVYVVDEEKKAVGVVGYAEILRAVQADLQANMRAHTYSESSLFVYF